MSIRAEAEELLTGLQIPAFLKFVQTRPPEKFVSLFTEKVCLPPPDPPSTSPLSPSPIPHHPPSWQRFSIFFATLSTTMSINLANLV